VGHDNGFPDGGESPFLHAINQLLREHGFDDFAEGRCAPFLAFDRAILFRRLG
jgi:hypothetical protein